MKILKILTVVSLALVLTSCNHRKSLDTHIDTTPKTDAQIRAELDADVAKIRADMHSQETKAAQLKQCKRDEALDYHIKTGNYLTEEAARNLCYKY